MDKSTIKALILAGAGIVGAVSQMLILRAAKKRKAQEAAINDKEKSQFEELKKSD